MDYTGKGQGNYNTVAGSLGLAAFAGQILGGGCGNGLGGILGGNGNNGDCYINRFELGLALSDAAKDSKIALLEANIFTDQKLNDFRNYVDGRFAVVNGELREQAVFNATAISTVSCLKGQVDQLMGLTKLVIPNDSVCPGWGSVCTSIIPCPATSNVVAK